MLPIIPTPKYIFLDIDGVLWTCGWSIFARRKWPDERRTYKEWDPIASSNLQWVLEKIPEARIVISSTWRLGRQIEELKEIATASGIDASKIVGVTPRLARLPNGHSEERGNEIQFWMSENMVSAKDIVIIDDDSDMAHLKYCLIKTDSAEGFTFKKAQETVKYLKSE